MLDLKSLVAPERTALVTVEVQDGVVRNPAVLNFQQRAPGYPHAVLSDTPAA